MADREQPEFEPGEPESVLSFSSTYPSSTATGLHSAVAHKRLQAEELLSA